MAEQPLQESESRWTLMSREGGDGYRWLSIIDGPIVGADGDTFEVVPRAVAERLAEALALCPGPEAQDALAAFYARYPEPEEAER